MLRALLRPGWIVSHLVVVLIAVLFVSLGFWQLRRLDERRAANAVISARISEPAQPLAQVLGRYGNDPAAVSHRRVTVAGRYQAADEVLLTPRSRDGAAGHHVLTPLVLADGSAIMIERGWVPFALDTPPVAQAAPPAAEVTVVGLLVPTQEATRFGSAGESDRVEFLSAADVDRLQPQVDMALLPFSVILQEQSPAGGELPLAPAALDLSEGPHQSYALQWFAFALVGVIGYPFVIRRRLRHARLDGRLDGPDSTAFNALNTSTTSSATTP